MTIDLQDSNIIIDCNNAASITTDHTIARKSRLQLNNIKPSKEIVLTLSTRNRELYKYFPFLVEIAVNGRVEAVLEASCEWERHDVALPLPGWNIDAVDITISSEQGGVPKDLGIGEDVREISLVLSKVEFRDTRTIPTRSEFRQRQALHSSWPLPEGERPAPIFVIGAPRSMTSIATWAIGQHPNICAFEETNWLTMLYLGSRAAFALSEKPKDSPAQAYGIDAQDFLQLQGWGIDRLHRQLAEQRIRNVDTARLANMDDQYNANFALRQSPRAAKRRWIDGTPENTGMAIGLAEMFPAAQFIFMLREPTEVVRSLTHHANAGGIDRAIEEAVQVWERATQWAYEALEMLGPQRVHLTASDDIAKNPHQVVSKWFAFLDEPQYDQATRVFDTVINSSGEHGRVDDLGMSTSEIQRLQAIHRGILCGVNSNSLPWTENLWKFSERRDHFVQSLRQAIS